MRKLMLAAAALCWSAFCFAPVPLRLRFILAQAPRSRSPKIVNGPWL